jgi:hypothetical protein
MSKKDKNGISRLQFLKDSGITAAGFLFFNSTDLKSYINVIASYQIVLPAQANETEKHAAAQLQRYLSEMAGTKIPIVKENVYRGKAGIFLGNTSLAKSKGVDVRPLHADGYIYQPAGNNYIIAGGTGNGTLYGVFALLELAGCRKYTSACTFVPKNSAFTFPKKAIKDVPFIHYRSTSYHDTRDKDYMEWHRLSSRDSWGMFVHTFNELVSPDEYGVTHPEYYSLRQGNRQPGTQLCLAEPKVLEITITNLRKKIAEKPDALYWSVSQNDNDQYCTCNRCTALNNKYGGVPSGSILHFVNQVAKAFPDKIISTLAYWYSRSAPSNIKAEPNVNIMLCNIESKRQRPVYVTDPAFTNDLKQWGQLAGNILIWDYNIQFANLVSPFPNLHTIEPNIKFYTENHVNSLFMQANSQTGGEFAGLRAYLISKLMWDPDANDKTIIDDYLNGYFGAAARYIGQYIDTMRDALLKSEFELSIFGDPIDAKDSYLSAELMHEYKRLFDAAEATVAKQPELLKRVQVARLPIMYAEIQIGRQEVDTPRSLYKREASGRVIAKPEMIAMLQQFVQRCNEEGVTRLRERSTPPDDYLQSYNRVFTNMAKMDKTISFGKKIQSVTQPATKHIGAEGLTDGMFGSYESWSNPDAHWVGYEGTHIDFILDLGEVMPVSRVSMDFLNAQAQPDWNLLALPKFVTYELSEDGSSYNDVKRIDNPHEPDPKINPDIAKIPVYHFAAQWESKRARYIKVHAESLLHMPSWHIRTGQPMWLYCDEIVVE